MPHHVPPSERSAVAASPAACSAFLQSCPGQLDPNSEMDTKNYENNISTNKDKVENGWMDYIK